MPRRVTLLIKLLIVRLRNLPFAIDHIGVLKSNYACGWTTCGQQRQPLTSRFALIYHIRSHTDKMDSDSITFVPPSSPPQHESARVFGDPAAPSFTSAPPPNTSYDSLDIHSLRFPFE